MKRVILYLFLVLALTACGSSRVAELRPVETTTITELIIENSEIIETTLEETTEEETTVEETTKSNEWADYSDEVREIITKYEGVDYQSSRKITNAELNKLNSAGFYMITYGVSQTRGADDITRSTGGSTKFQTKQDLENYVATTFVKEKGGFDTTGYAVYDAEISKILMNTQVEILKGSWEAKEENKKKFAESYVKVNTNPNSPAKYINGLGDGQYTIKFGLVVPARPVDRHDPASNYNYISKKNYETFCRTEVLCF